MVSGIASRYSNGSTASTARHASWRWAEHRSHLNRGTPAPYCNPVITTASEVSWRNGCIAAKAKLAPLDARRKAKPDYKAGSNEESSEFPPISRR